MTNPVLCPKCSASLPTEAQFCPGCGKRVKSNKISFSLPVILSLIFLAGFAATGTHLISDSLMGKMPTETENSVGTEDESDDPAIATLRTSVEKDPTNIELKKSLAQKLFESLPYIPNPQKRAIEVLDLAMKILQAAPNDPPTMLLMANLSFDQKVFDKAKLYYEKYLSIKPDDYQARAAYGSALNFMDDFDGAIRELDKVIKSNPNYFQALAYKAIALSEQGKKKEALEVGEVALKSAPSAEARSRFKLFLDSITADDSAKTEKNTLDPVSASIKSNQIAGDKYVKSEKKPDGTLQIHLRNFPMDKMPPMAMEVFFAKLKVAAQGDKSIKKIVFIDADTGAAMKALDGPF